MASISIIGVGRVGGALALSLPPEKYTIDTLVHTSADVPGFLAAAASKCSTFDHLTMIPSDVVFITTQDARIAAVAAQLAQLVKSGTIIFHTSGALSSSVLADLKTVGAVTGSIHPLVSISRSELGPERFKGSYFCIEGEPAAVEMGRKIVADLRGHSFSIDTRYKTLYHAAAVTACGHLVALFDASVEMMTGCGLSGDDAKQLLLPLVTSTVKNLSQQSTAAALTGTFARADIDTFTRHLTALNEYASDDLLEIYLLLGERSLELAAKQGVSADKIDSLRTKVLIAKSKVKW